MMKHDTRDNCLKYFVLPTAAALLTAAVYLLYCYFWDFYPFGGRSLAWCDLEQQYLPLVMELKTALSSDGSLFLGRGGGGMNFYGVFLFFVSSPLSLLTLAVDNSDMLHFINILTILKAALCAASAEVWFVCTFPKLRAPFGIIMSMSYALSGYVMMYYQNNMWLDMMILFPILLISMMRLCESGKWGLYSVCIALSMLLNFYISYMIVLYILLAGAGMLVFCCDRDKRGDRAVKMLLGDVCAALMSAVVWIPAFIQFSSSGRSSSTLNIFVNNAPDDNFFDKAALLSCTGLVLAAAAAAIVFRKRLMHGRPAFFAIMSAILLIGLFIGPANKLWHTGSYQAYPLRYGFIVILLVFSLCAELLQTAPDAVADDGMNPVYAAAVAMIYVVGAATAVGIIHRDKLNSYSHSLWTDVPDALGLIGIGLLTSALYFIVMYGFISGKTNRRFTAFVMSAALFAESLLGFTVYISDILDPRLRFASASESLTMIPDDDDFCRTEIARRFYYSNMAEGFGVPTLGHYTSLTDRDFLYASKRFGYTSYWMDATAGGGTVYSDAFLMNRYLIAQPVDAGAAYELVSEGEYLNVYRNTLACSGALICGNSPDELADFDKYERADSAEFLAQRLFGVSGTVEKYAPDKLTGVTMQEKDGVITLVPDEKAELCEVRFKVDVKGTQELYFDAFGCYSTSVREDYFDALSFTVNGRSTQVSYPNSLFNGMADLGTFCDETVVVAVQVLEPAELTSFGVCSIDLMRAAEAIKSARTAPISIHKNKVTINAQGRAGEWLYIPLLALDGYSARLNGSPVQTSRVLGAFMAVQLTDGDNELVLTFVPRGFRAGAVLTVIGIALFAALLILTRRKQLTGTLLRAAESVVLAAGAFTFIALYIVSCVVWIVLRLAQVF